MTQISNVHYSRKYNNAFWDGIVYGDGDGVTFIPLSQDLDVVAHELTHGVTERTSNLVYSYESGESYITVDPKHCYIHELRPSNFVLPLINRCALSDIFAAFVEKWKDQSDDPANDHINDAVWKIGENIYTPATAGDALRYMYDPKRSNDYDYYPTRYVGTCNNGGVHWNSGIANLGKYD
jgi:bacillolysin